MKQVTAFIGSLGGGGAQGVFITVMNYYVSLGYKVNVVINTMTNDVHSKELDKNIKIICLEANSSKESLPKIINYIKNNAIELAFAFSPELAINVIIGRSVSGKKFPIIGRCINTLSYEYSHAEGLFRRLVTNNLVKRCYHKADCVIAQSERMREDLIQNFCFKPDSVLTINNPLTDKFSREIDCKPTDERDKYILYVGRFEKQKGLDMLLNAFAMLSHKDIKLLLIGKGSLKEKIQELAKQLDIEKRVEIISFTKNIEEYYRKALLTVMSSYFEGFPNVLSESIACGTPVVSFDLPSGPSDIVIEGENGYLAEYLSIDDLTMKIDQSLDRQWDYKNIKKTANRFRKENILPMYRDLLRMTETV